VSRSRPPEAESGGSEEEEEATDEEGDAGDGEKLPQPKKPVKGELQIFAPLDALMKQRSRAFVSKLAASLDTSVRITASV
jgi:hypothetical protein